MKLRSLAETSTFNQRRDLNLERHELAEAQGISVFWTSPFTASEFACGRPAPRLGGAVARGDLAVLELQPAVLLHC